MTEWLDWPCYPIQQGWNAHAFRMALQGSAGQERDRRIAAGKPDADLDVVAIEAEILVLWLESMSPAGTC